MAKTSFTTTDTQVRKTLGDWFAKVPPLSSSAKDFIELVLPWFALIVGIINICSIISLLSPYLFGVGSITYIGSFVVGVLLLMAFPKLQHHFFLGWKYVYWAILLDIVLSIINDSLSSVLIGVILLYLLFQVEKKYK